MNQLGRSYPSDLTNQQWDAIKRMILPARRGGRRRTTDVRNVLNAIFYLNRTGCTWRYLPKEFPPWRTTYDYFIRWEQDGTWLRISKYLARSARVLVGKKPTPSVVAIDSQSTKAQFGENRGYDGFKKVRGRKRHIIVDTNGILHGVRVSAANLGDVQEGLELFVATKTLFRKRQLRAVYADGGYRNRFADGISEKFGAKTKIIHAKTMMITSPNPQAKHAKRKVVIEHNLRPVRWVVERTFAWFNHYRRLTRDYEKKTSRAEAMIHIAMSQILLKRLCP